jgi:hypothetical protein
LPCTPFVLEKGLLLFGGIAAHELLRTRVRNRCNEMSAPRQPEHIKMRSTNGTRETSDKTRTGERWWDRAAALGLDGGLACSAHLRVTNARDELSAPGRPEGTGVRP